MRFFSFLLITLLSFATPSYSQWSDFNISVIPSQWGDKTKAFMQVNKFKNHLVLTQGGITPSVTNDSTISPETIKNYMLRTFPTINSEGLLVLDWEAEVFENLRDLPETDSRFKYSEKQFIALINEIRKHRPKVKISIYGMTFRGYSDWQKTNYNRPGSLDNIISNVDFISPSLYIGYTDEEKGREYNLSFLKDNLDIAFNYAKRHNKPVIPFMWHRVLEANKLYSRAILQKEVYAAYIKFISTYTNNGFKASGVFLWDDPYTSSRLKDVAGVNNWLQGSIIDAATYDNMTLEMMKSIVNALNAN